MHGGKRAGAGRKKGQPVKKIRERKEAMQAMAKKLSATLPNAFDGEAHDLLMAVYKDQDLPLPIRLDAAKAAIGYEKPKLANVEMKADVTITPEEQMLQELMNKSRGLPNGVGAPANH